jgi:hypothetical protein
MKGRDQFENQLDLKQKLAAAAVYPLKPEEKDLAVDKKDDQRPVYTCVALGTIAFFFVGMILLTGAGRGEDLPPEYGGEQLAYEQQLAAYEHANGNGNGHYGEQDVFSSPTSADRAEEPVEV